MTLKEIATALRLKDSSPLRHAIEQGTLKAQKDGRDWFVKVEDFERYKQTRRPRGRPRKAGGVEH